MQTIQGKIAKLHILAHNEEVPKELYADEGINYFQIKDKIWRLENNGVLTGFYPAKEDKEYDELLGKFGKDAYDNTKIWMLDNKIYNTNFPIAEFQWVMKYFQQIYDRDKTEAGVYLLYHQALNEWKVLPVVQVDCSGGSVNYLPPTGIFNDDHKGREYKKAMEESPEAVANQARVVENYNRLYAEGWRIYGTIHSHCEMNAFHSGVDDADELDFDGLHITIGKVRSGFHYAARLMFKRGIWPVDMSKLLKVEKLSDLNDLDHVNISQEDMDLLMKDIGRRPVVQHIKQYNNDDNQSYGYGHHYPIKATKIEPSNNHDFLWHNREVGEENSIEDYSQWSEWHKNVFEVDELVAVLDLAQNKIIYVQYNYWIKNRQMFPSNQYRKMDLAQKPQLPARKVSVPSKQILLINDGDLDPDQAADGTVKVREAKRLKRKKAKNIAKIWRGCK